MSSVGKDKRKVASVAVIHDGKMLWLLRADEKKLCLPGGKFEEGEEPLDAAVRELKEETGIEADPKALEFLGSENVSGTKLHVYSFKYEPKEKPEVDLTKDPDAEATGHHWFEELPSDGEQFVPQEKNVTLRLLGMQVQDLNKMAIKDVKPGVEIRPNRFDYTHLLPQDVQSEGHKMFLNSTPALYDKKRHRLEVVIHHPVDLSSNRQISWLTGRINPTGALEIEEARIQTPWRGRGMGRTMYEAAMAHAFHNHNVRQVVGDKHSSLASKAHRALSDKHGFDYEPQENPDYDPSKEDPGGAYDDKYLPYGYALKSELAKSQPEWRSKDGLKIPKVGTPARKQWDKDYYNRLLEVFAGGNKDRLKLVKIPVTPQLSGTNMAVNKDRLNLYTRMIGGGDKLPPAIVKRNGIGWHVVDGNHRAQAALNRGVPEMDAYELLDPPKVKKAEEPFKGLAEHIVESLTDDLRKPKYKGHENPLTGHCYVASEALWHILGGPESGWVPQTIRHENDTHWYLKHKDTGKILDVTAGQFKTKVPYDKGRGCGFLTREPSKRAKELITRIKTKQAQANDPTLSKGFPGALMAAGLMTAPMNTDMMKQPQPQVQQQVAQWTPDGLDPDLIPIAHLESSFGKNVNHAPNAKGEYHTAFGAVGMKPITAHEEYNKNQTLQQNYPNLKDPADFMKAFKTNPRFYNLLASVHFARMKHLHGSAAKAAYAWRHGHGAATGATPEQMDSDLYVQKYRHLATQTGLQKAEKDDEFKLEEDLVKSISSLKPGEAIGGPYTRADSQYYDYSHLLSPVMKRNYKIVLSSTANPTYGGHHVIAKVFYKSPGLSKEQALDWTNWEPAGYLNVSHEDGILRPSVTQLWAQHRGKGLGKAMYLAAFKHGMHELKAHSVEGEEHSSMANKVHAAISKEHGMNYAPRKIGPEVGPNDGAYGDYQYRLK